MPGARKQVVSASPGALSCFRSAAALCHPASIAIGVSGIDTGDDYLVEIRQGCRAVLLSQSWPRHFVGDDRIHKTSCSTIAATLTGVTLTCHRTTYLISSQGLFITR